MSEPLHQAILQKPALTENRQTNQNSEFGDDKSLINIQ